MARCNEIAASNVIKRQSIHANANNIEELYSFFQALSDQPNTIYDLSHTILTIQQVKQEPCNGDEIYVSYLPL